MFLGFICFDNFVDPNPYSFGQARNKINKNIIYLNSYSEYRDFKAFGLDSTRPTEIVVTALTGRPLINILPNKNKLIIGGFCQKSLLRLSKNVRPDPGSDPLLPSGGRGNSLEARGFSNGFPVPGGLFAPEKISKYRI